MDVIDLWFMCKNADCDYIPLKTKKEKTRYWRDGLSIMNSARKRCFMRMVEGYRVYRNNNDLVLFVCKYGDIIIFNAKPELFPDMANDWINPIKDKELCNPCINRINNEKRLLQSQ